VQIVTLMEGRSMHAIFATSAAAGLAGAIIVSGPKTPAPVESPRPVVIDSAAQPVARSQVIVRDSLRAEAQLTPAQVRRPLEQYLGRYSADRVLVRRISRAVLRESKR